MARRNSFRMRSGRTFPVLMTLAVIAVLGTVLWYSYPKEKDYREANSVPLIRADAGPIKTVPNDPGGMDVPYRESTVFDTLRKARAENGEGEVENLLSETEEPMSRAQMFAGVNTEIEGETKDMIAGDARTANDGNTQESSAEVGSIAAVNVDKGAPKTRESSVVKPDTVKERAALAAVESQAVDAPVPSRKPEEAADNMSRTEPAAGSTVIAATGGYLVQLASVRSRNDAEKMWRRLQKTFPAQLGTLDLNIDVADLGSRGIYYRVQGGAVSEPRARAICSVIDTKKAGGCFVVRNR